MDALNFIFLMLGLIILSIIWAHHAKKKFFPAASIAVFSSALIISIGVWTENAGEENLRYHYETTLPFEYNMSDREYYVYHQDEFKNAEDHVKGFSDKLINTPEYDSCYVYTVQTPVFMGFLHNKTWHPEVVYRQSDDILLQRREVISVEVK